MVNAPEISCFRHHGILLLQTRASGLLPAGIDRCTCTPSTGRASRGPEMPDDDDRPAVLVQTRYDRFPATVKGAFVLRGGDANPHLVRVVRAGIDAVPEGAAKEIPMGHIDVDVAPGRDLFVPFEAGIADLDPGWYVIAAEMEVDGDAIERSAGRPFSVPWPRGEVRTGSVPVGESVRLGDASLRVDRAELKSDRVILVWGQ